MTRIAWGVTGAGHFLTECAGWLAESPNVDVFLSRAAEEVVRMYGVEDAISKGGARVYRESHNLASSPVVARFARGVYRVFLVAPASGNTVAKFAHGISDSLISNLFAQAGKSRVPIIVLPTDIAPEVDSPGPRGGLVKVYPRRIDLENVARLREFERLSVVTSLEELRASLEPYLRDD